MLVVGAARKRGIGLGIGSIEAGFAAVLIVGGRGWRMDLWV